MKSLPNNKITVIIPFLNEGKEVYNTVKNLRETSEENFNILLINDASTDDFDYKQVAVDFNAQYLEHKERKGVAASRDEGVDICPTEYFILLDAHMRVYQNNWVTLLLNELRKDKRSLFCCKTMMLNTQGEIVSDAVKSYGFGAHINFENLSVNWIANDPCPEKPICDIPCVLGASYACNKTYWKYIKGLQGLVFYGLDEQLISIKVWMEGGRCRLIKDIAFGHLFRVFEEVPYQMDANDFICNKFYVIELFSENIHNSIKLLKKNREEIGIENFNTIVDFLLKRKDDILEEKRYYKNIFTRNIDFIYNLNNEYKIK
jgi:glycosyltransferase involved in cell wall biosynthesis